MAVTACGQYLRSLPTPVLLCLVSQPAFPPPESLVTECHRFYLPESVLILLLNIFAVDFKNSGLMVLFSAE